MTESNIILIEKLIKRFPVGGGEFTALNGIDLAFKEGEFAGIVGPSGSGKTTLLNIIGTLDTPSEGKTIVNGSSVGDLTHKEAALLRNKYIGFIFQTNNLLPYYTVYENVEFPLLLLKMSASERRNAIMDALDWVGIADKVKSRPAQLSGGECQRVAIARAMVKRPKLVLADEPTANLDAENSHNVLQTMKKLNNDLNTTFVFSTHDEKVIEYLQRKILLVDGKVVKDETIKL